MSLEELTFKKAKKYLLKNMPTEKIKNIYELRDEWHQRNPLLELMRVNMGLHNDLVRGCYDEWNYCSGLRYEKVVDYMIAGEIPKGAQHELPWHIFDDFKSFEIPLIDIMKTSPRLRKTCLQEFKRHMIYHAMDRVGEMQYRNNCYCVENKDIMRPLRSAIKFDRALKREFS